MGPLADNAARRKPQAASWLLGRPAATVVALALTERERHIALTAWELGAAAERERLCQISDDLRVGLPMARESREQRIAREVAEMARRAVTHHPGGPVPAW